MDHKFLAVVDVKAYSPRASAAPAFADPPITPKKSSRAYTDVIFAGLVITIPMIVLSVALLWIIYANRIDQTELDPLILRFSNNVDSDLSAFLVKYSATRLITIASWTSSVAPLLPTFVLTLLSFPAAWRLLRTSQAGQEQYLPTPYQLSLYLQLLGGGFGALWQWVKYRMWSKREKQASVVTHLVVGLTFATMIGYGILAADTWLHVATSTVLHQQVTQVPFTASHSYGRCLYSDICSIRRSGNPCTIDSPASTQILNGANEAYATVNNVSNMNQISSFTSEGVDYAILMPASIPQGTDFRAATFALNTQCKLVSRSCNLRAASGASTPFNCSTGFHGDATALKDTTNGGYRRAASPVGLVLLSEWEGKTNITFSSKDLNPFYIGTWAKVDTQSHLPGMPDTAAQLNRDNEIVVPVHGGMAWVLKCSARVYDLVYTYINGTITDPLLNLANATTGGLIAAPLNENFALLNLETATTVASFSSSTQKLADKWANSFSQTALGLSAGVMSPKPNIIEHQRTSMLLARVPKALLFTLVGLNLVYATVGIVLAFYAALCSDIAGGTGAVRQRLTIPGLIAECFEDPGRARKGRSEVEGLFVERDGKGLSGRVGLQEVDDRGWRLRSS